MIGKPVDLFSFPFGRPDNIRPATMQIIQTVATSQISLPTVDLSGPEQILTTFQGQEHTTNHLLFIVCCRSRA